MKKNIVIIHYNTPYLTECLVKSINLFVKDAFIYIFDNSDKSPFTAKYDNVTVIDNTKGQVINFDEWLKKYPKKSVSNGRVNLWGSAKHCVSVEKCIELIDDGFILLDSDVLLKKDISNLFNENVIYAGEVIPQPLSSIKRILPFICFINAKMCKDKNIHYFDDNYMHGLYKTATADKYDTGAGFYVNTLNLPKTSIKCDDYIVHYGHGSWNKDGYKQKYTANEWLKLHKKLWSGEKNKNVVYTCITGGYDRLLEPETTCDGFDYICFTDDSNLKSDIWEIRPLPKEADELSQIKKQRYVKINPHKLLKEYDLSIWVDGNVRLKGNLNEFIEETLKDNCSVYVPKHPQRNCIYKESEVVIKMKKDKAEIINSQIERYKKERFPENYGLLQSNILLRKHNDKDCIKLMEDWFEEIKNGSHRDQLSFNYVSWKNKDINVVYMDKGICHSKYFHWNMFHLKQKDNEPVHASSSKNTVCHPHKKILTQEIGLY